MVAGNFGELFVLYWTQLIIKNVTLEESDRECSTELSAKLGSSIEIDDWNSIIESAVCVHQNLPKLAHYPTISQLSSSRERVLKLIQIKSSANNARKLWAATIAIIKSH